MNYFENIDEPQEEVKKRPVFLTVLCILTFVGCGLTLIGAVYGLATDPAAGLAKSLEAQKDNPQVADMMLKIMSRIGEYVKWAKITNYVSLANFALCLAGSLLMWNLRKSGFFMYVGGQVAAFAVAIPTYLVVADIPFLGMMALIGVVFSALVYVAFIVMYGVNLKHMR